MSVQWGAWAGGGMASAETSARVERMGMGMIQPQQGLRAMQGIVAAVAAAAVTGANPVVWDRFLQRLRPRQLTQLFDGFASHAPTAAAAPALGGARAAGSLRPAAHEGLTLDAVAGQVAAAVAAVLGAPVADSASLMEAGLDSLGSVELRNSLSKQFGLDLPATLTFDYPTAAAISGFIAEAVAPAVAASSAHEAGCAGSSSLLQPAPAERAAGAAALAVTGVSLRMAGGIESLGALHEALATTAELQTVGPFGRWDTGAFGPPDQLECAEHDGPEHPPTPPSLQMCTSAQLEASAVCHLALAPLCTRPTSLTPRLLGCRVRAQGGTAAPALPLQVVLWPIQPAMDAPHCCAVNEAGLMDPQQRILLEETLAAFQTAGGAASGAAP